jgi:Cft2 family RNA processing exonuclease
MLLELGTFRILVDAGMHPKFKGTQALPKLSILQGRPLDLILLTHCHLDHLGSLPVVCKQHPDTPVVMSPASHQIFRRMLMNSTTIMARQRSDSGISPLYHRRDVEKASRNAFPLIPGQPRFFSSHEGERLTITFHHAGHIPGACGIMLELRHRKIFISGDVLFTAQSILGGARFPKEKMDTLILETTRGTTERESGETRQTEVERLITTIRHTISHGGSILIPAFALGRLQEILSQIHSARQHHQLPKAPIYVSGLGLDLVDYFDKISTADRDVHFRRKILRELGARKLPENHHPGSEGPGIYVVSSGMMVAHTPSYNVAAKLLGDHKNCIAFVGYCDPDTPGGKLLETRQGEKFVFEAIDRIVEVRAHIEKFDLSSHADRSELVEWAAICNPRSIVLTHGDPDARQWFRDSLTDVIPGVQIHDPIPLQQTEV